MAFTFRTGLASGYYSSSWRVILPVAAGSSDVYFNRKFHSPSGTYHYWQTDAPDPTMAQTTPPNPVAQYTDYVILEVRR